MLSKLSGSLELMRFGRSIIGALIVFPLTWRIDHYVVFLFFLLFSYAWNDFVDQDMDQDGHPNRPIPSGRISSTEALLLSLVLLSVGGFYSAVKMPDMLQIYGLFCFLSAIYSWPLKRHLPLIATPVWTISVVSMALWPSDITVVGWLIFFVALYTHEFLLDVRDMESDRTHCTTPSLAVILGERSWYLVLGLFFLLGLCFEAYVPMITVNILTEGELFPNATPWGGRFLMWSYMLLIIISIYVTCQRDYCRLTATVWYYKSLLLLSFVLI